MKTNLGVLLMFMAGLLAGACSTRRAPEAAGVSRVTGSITTAERVSLPPGALVRVTIADLGPGNTPGRDIAETTVRADGRAPLKFALDFVPSPVEAAHRRVVAVRVTDGAGRLRWVTWPPPPLPAQGRSRQMKITLQRADSVRARAESRVVAVECEELHFTANIQGDLTRVFLPNRTEDLPRIWPASGTRYGNGGTTLWVEGNAAYFETLGQKYRTCTVGLP